MTAIQIMRDVFSAAFYAVPIALLFVWFGRDAFAKRPAAWLPVTALLFMWAWRMALGSHVVGAGLFSPRYYLLAAAVSAAIAPAGLYGMLKLAGRVVPPLTRLNFGKLTLLAAALICAGQCLRIFNTGEKRFLNDFAAAAHPYNSPGTLLIDGTREGDRLREMGNSEIELFTADRSREIYYYWEELLDKIQTAPLDRREILVFGREKLGCPPDETFEATVRDNLTIFPFDLLASADYRHTRYLLYRFNWKIDDRRGYPMPSSLHKYTRPEPGSIGLPVGDESCKIPVIADRGVIDAVTLPWGNGTVFRGDYCFNPVAELANLELPDGKTQFTLRITARNTLLWPFLRADIPARLGAGEDARPRTINPPEAIAADAPPAAEFAPLLTLPQTAYLLPGDRIYGENLLALPAPGRTVRFDGGGTDAEWFNPPPLSGEVVLTASDQFLPGIAEGRFRVEFGSAPAVPASVKILLTAPEIVDAPKNRYAKLPATLAANNVTAEVSLFSGRTAEQAEPAFGRDPEGFAAALPEGDFDFVILDPGRADIAELARFYLIPSERRKLEQNIDRLIELVAARYPRARVALAVPAAPFPYQPKFDIGTSVRWNRKRLAHRKLQQSLDAAAARRADNRVSVLPLYLTIPWPDGYNTISEPPPAAIDPQCPSQPGYDAQINAISSWILFQLKDKKL